MNLTTRQYLDVPQQMVLEIAYGVENPWAIAERYGFTEDQWLDLKTHEPFIKQVDAKKIELKSSGVTFRLKAQMASEDLLEQIYLKAMAPDAPFSVQMESFKVLTKAAGLDAPAKEAGEKQAQFSISINLGGGKSVQIGINTAQAQPDDVVEAEVVDFDELPSVPIYLQGQPTQLNASLAQI